MAKEKKGASMIANRHFMKGLGNVSSSAQRENVENMLRQEQSAADRGIDDPNAEEFQNRNVIEETKQRMAHTAKLVQLEILLLNYTFYEDDQKISFKEKRSIKKHFSTYKNRITKEHLLEIEETTGKVYSINEIRSFINLKQLSKKDITQALHTVKKICKKTENYNFITRTLEEQILENDDYLTNREG